MVSVPCGFGDDWESYALWKPVVVGTMEDVLSRDRREPQFAFSGPLWRCRRWFDGRHDAGWVFWGFEDVAVSGHGVDRSRDI